MTKLYLESHLGDYLIQLLSVDENWVPQSELQTWGSTQILDALIVTDEQ